MAIYKIGYAVIGNGSINVEAGSKEEAVEKFGDIPFFELEKQVGDLEMDVVEEPELDTEEGAVADLIYPFFFTPEFENKVVYVSMKVNGSYIGGVQAVVFSVSGPTESEAGFGENGDSETISPDDVGWDGVEIPGGCVKTLAEAEALFKARPPETEDE